VIEVADVDADGDLDVIGGRSAGQVQLFRAPDWALTELVPTGDGSYVDDPFQIEAADVDGDGHADLVVAFDHWDPNGGELYASDDGRIDVFFGSEGGAFTRAHIGEGFDARGAASGDLDGDGDVDLAAVSLDGGVRWWEQTSARAFTAHTLAEATDALLRYAGVAIADLDGDGRGELYAGDQGGVARVWTDVVTGEPAPPIVIGEDDVWAIELADLDGDSDRDLVMLAGDPGLHEGEVWWFENRGGDLTPAE
jgi:hypothetical protein